MLSGSDWLLIWSAAAIVGLLQDLMAVLVFSFFSDHSVSLRDGSAVSEIVN